MKTKKTADGVEIVQGMKVYHHDYKHGFIVDLNVNNYMGKIHGRHQRGSKPRVIIDEYPYDLYASKKELMKYEVMKVELDREVNRLGLKSLDLLEKYASYLKEVNMHDYNVINNLNRLCDLISWCDLDDEAKDIDYYQGYKGE
jgi:hypothetical protein